MVEFGKRLRRIKLRHSSVDVYRYMCLTSCSAVFVGLKERHERKWRRCYVIVILNYGAYCCISLYRGRPAKVSNCSEDDNKDAHDDADDDADDDRDGGGGGEDSADDDDDGDA